VPRRGRPNPRQVAAIRRVILSTARSLFLSRGFAKTSMSEIATTAGISKGTLYSRYPTKAALFEAITSDRLDACRVIGRGEPQVKGDIAKKMLARALGMLEVMRSPQIQAFDRLILSESVQFPEIAKAYYEKGHCETVAALAEELAAVGRTNGDPTEDAEAVATIFASTLISWFRTEVMVRNVSQEEGRAFCYRLVELFLRGRDAW
jgi:TetR/AcrR family transcriptional repressor of mexJK operon